MFSLFNNGFHKRYHIDKIWLFIFLFTSACSNEFSENKSELEKNEIKNFSINPISIDISCHSKDDLSFYLPLLLTNSSISELRKEILKGSYIGYIVGTKVNKVDNILDKINIRASELNSITACLSNQLMFNQKISLKSYEGHPAGQDIDSSNKDLISETINSVDKLKVREKIDKLYEDVKSGGWKSAHKLAFEVSRDLDALERNHHLISLDLKRSLDQKFEEFKNLHMENRVLKCSNQLTPIPVANLGLHYIDDLMRNLINSSCYEDKAAIRNIFLSHLLAMYLISPADTVFFHDKIYEANDASSIDFIWNSFLKRNSVIARIQQWNEIFDQVAIKDLGELHQQKAVFTESVILKFFGKDDQSHRGLKVDVNELLVRSI